MWANIYPHKKENGAQGQARGISRGNQNPGPIFNREMAPLIDRQIEPIQKRKKKMAPKVRHVASLSVVKNLYRFKKKEQNGVQDQARAWRLFSAVQNLYHCSKTDIHSQARGEFFRPFKM